MTASLRTERLELVPLVPAFLRAFLQRDFTKAGRILGLSLPEGLADSADVMSLRLEQLEADPTFQPWSLRAVALRYRPVMIGHIGFHTAPGAEYLQAYAPGGVEFGFTVYPPFLRQGYAREASIEMMRWARQVRGVTRFVLSIRPDNTASQALAADLGFTRIGSHLDEVDGLEDILELRVSPDDGSTPAPTNADRIRHLPHLPFPGREELLGRGLRPDSLELYELWKEGHREAGLLAARLPEVFGDPPRPRITLHVARGYDDEWFLTAEREAELTALDPERHWREVPADAVEWFQEYFTFSDAEGWRFYLPAFLRHYLGAFPLNTHDAVQDACVRRDRFQLLTPEQVAFIDEFLALCRTWED